MRGNTEGDVDAAGFHNGGRLVFVEVEAADGGAGAEAGEETGCRLDGGEEHGGCCCCCCYLDIKYQEVSIVEHRAPSWVSFNGSKVLLKYENFTSTITIIME